MSCNLRFLAFIVDSIHCSAEFSAIFCYFKNFLFSFFVETFSLFTLRDRLLPLFIGPEVNVSFFLYPFPLLWEDFNTCTGCARPLSRQNKNIADSAEGTLCQFS